MGNEVEKLERDLERYRFLLRTVTDPIAREVITELMSEAQAQLRKLSDA